MIAGLVFSIGMFIFGGAIVWLFHDYEAERPPSQGA